MNASEKSLWIQLVAAILAVVMVLCLLPMLGDRAMGGFAVMAVGAIGGLVVGRQAWSSTNVILSFKKQPYTVGK